GGGWCRWSPRPRPGVPPPPPGAAPPPPPPPTTPTPALGPNAADGEAWQPRSLREALEQAERDILRRALTAHGGNRQDTARALGINRSTLFTKMRKLDLQ
ncbi:MAG: helix-turn-helix domain-containing protein, partial [Planctomycetota bacterium]